MKRVLFVDDEPRVLDGLKRMLRGMRKEWDMAFAGSGEQALELMAGEPFDVVVTDMRMPGMDGAELLSRVQALHPQSVRIVLSGHAELEAALRAVPVAHQFLSKPCDSDTIREVVDRACRLQTLLGDRNLQQAVSHVRSLPPVPEVYRKLTAALANPEVAVADLVEIVAQDAAISAKILQLVNSSFFGLARRITTIADAISYLGTSVLKNVVLTAEVFRETPEVKVAGFSLAREQQHALFTARLAKEILDGGAADDAFVAGLLHDVGKLVLAVELPEHYGAAAAAQAPGEPFHEAEQRVHGIGHAEIGGFLLGIWGLPYPIVEAVANHHAPSRVACARLDVFGAVHVADALAAEISGDPAPARIDADFVAAVGIHEDRLAAWRTRAEELAVSAGAAE